MSIPFSSAETIPGLSAKTKESSSEIRSDISMVDVEREVLLSPTQEVSPLNTEEDSFYSIVFYIKRLIPASTSREGALSSSSSQAVSTGTGELASYLNLALGVGRAFIQQKIGLGWSDDTSCTSLAREEEYIPDVTPMSIKRTLSSIKLLAKHFVAKNVNAALEALIRRLLLGDVLREDGGDRHDPSAEDIQQFFSLCFEDPEIVKDPAMRGFLGGGNEKNDKMIEEGSSAAPSEKAALAIIFQSVSYVSILIPAGDMFGLDFVLEKGDSLVWKFNLAQMTSVDFMILFRSTENAKAIPSAQHIAQQMSFKLFDRLTRYGTGKVKELLAQEAAHGVTVLESGRITGGAEGSFTTDFLGTVRLVWDNSVNGSILLPAMNKRMTYFASSLSSSTKKAAAAAAIDLAASSTRCQSELLSALIDCSNVDINVDGPWRCVNVVHNDKIGSFARPTRDRGESFESSIFSAVPIDSTSGDVVLDDETSEAIDSCNSLKFRPLLSDPLGFVADVNSSAFYNVRTALGSLVTTVSARRLNKRDQQQQEALGGTQRDDAEVNSVEQDAVLEALRI